MKPGRGCRQNHLYWSMTCWGLVPSRPPQLAGGWGSPVSKRRRRAEAVGTGWKLLAGCSGLGPWQVQTEVQQR